MGSAEGKGKKKGGPNWCKGGENLTEGEMNKQKRGEFTGREGGKGKGPLAKKKLDTEGASNRSERGKKKRTTAIRERSPPKGKKKEICSQFRGDTVLREKGKGKARAAGFLEGGIPTKEKNPRKKKVVRKRLFKEREEPGAFVGKERSRRLQPKEKKNRGDFSVSRQKKLRSTQGAFTKPGGGKKRPPDGPKERIFDLGGKKKNDWRGWGKNVSGELCGGKEGLVSRGKVPLPTQKKKAEGGHLMS